MKRSSSVLTKGARIAGQTHIPATSECTAMPGNLPGLRRNCSSTLPRTRSRLEVASG